MPIRDDMSGFFGLVLVANSLLATAILAVVIFGV